MTFSLLPSIRITRYCRPKTLCCEAEKLTRPERVGTFLNFAIWAARAAPLVVLPARAYAVTYASAFGDDPNPAVNKLAKAVKAGTGGFVTGAAAIDGLVTAYARAGNTTNGAALAAQMAKFKKVPTLSGLVSFSASQHSVFGRKYRVIRIEGTKEKVIGSVVAKVLPKV
jgi:hypothetical protein